MDQLKLRGIGQIQAADLSFGDLTILIGPQATGKSIARQFLKLIADAGYVQNELARYGLDWSGKLAEFFDIYFGEGMRSLWKPNESSVEWNGKHIDIPQLVGRKRKAKNESLFLIPAQRVLTLRDGWPRPFTDYSSGDPFAVREFSEKLRNLSEKEFSSTENLFPQKNRLKSEIRELLETSIFRSFRLQIDKSRVQKRLVLGTTDHPLPYMVWSAGQREFVPLLLGLYWLLPSSKVARRDHLKWVVIEELEMGLHPQAITAVLMIVLELLSRGYRVCLSTHSSQVLECVWALQFLKSNSAKPKEVLDLFGVRKTASTVSIAEDSLRKIFKVFYFDTSGKTRDISSLDAGSDESSESEWGGLAEFSSRANRVVAQVIQDRVVGQ
jgi:hypothetical protein